MLTRTGHRLLTTFVALSHLVLSTILVLPASVHAQGGIDPDPPLIEHDRIAEGTIGDNQVFSATVTDDVGVETVVLQYRFDPSAPYQPVEMETIGSTDIYTVSIETQGTGAKSIQYYIEARDAAGNRSIRGFAFDPLERDLIRGSTQAPVADAGSTEPPATTGMSTGRKVLYGVLGLVVVGALAAAAGGGDSDDDGDETGVPVTITVQEP